MIFDLGVLFRHLLNILNFSRIHLSSTNWTSLLLWKLKFDFAAEFVFFRFSRHEPISIQANKMESMVTGINTDEVGTFSEFFVVVGVLFFFLLPFIFSLF